ncbi:MAG: PIN/TRAM domain-containing protein [Spirochaetota bacterium]
MMMNILRTAFILISALFSGLFFLQVSVPAAGLAAAAAVAVSFAVIIAVEYISHTFPARILLSAIVGLFSGLLLSVLVVSVISLFPLPVSPYRMAIVKALIAHILGFGVMMFTVIKNEEISLFNKIIPGNIDECAGGLSYKILDTSVIIDGRISDICETGFIEGVLVIPTFVLNELQMIADSADSIKRNRGRRGLDILNKMQKDESIKVKISDMDFPDVHEVDAKLVKLAKVMTAKVITNDFNLNKVAEFHGVQVLNINELSNALKPVVLPSEEMHVSLIKEGKDSNQAIGYLDDGTMVVVENGRKKLHADVDVLVTSVLQTTAGRMIFARIKD